LEIWLFIQQQSRKPQHLAINFVANIDYIKFQLCL